MKILSLILLIFIFSSTLFAHTCYFHQDSQDSGDIHFIRIDGRKVYSLFKPPISYHYEDIYSALSAFRSSKNPNDLVNHLNNLLERYSEAIQSEQSNVRYLTQLLEDDQVQWIGMQDSSEGMSLWSTHRGKVQDYLGMRDLLNGFSDQPEWNQEKTHQILYLMYEAHVIAYGENLEFSTKFIFVPLEDNDLLERSKELFEELQIASNTLTQLEERGMISSEKALVFRTLGGEALNKRGSTQITGENLITPSGELEDFLKEQEVEQPEVIEAITSYINTVDDFLRSATDPDRNKAIAESIHDQSGNGFILMTEAHQAIIKNELTQSCLD